MVNDDLVKCPLCGGFTHIDKPELLTALHDPKIRQQVESYVAELLSGELTSVVASKPQSKDFNKDAVSYTHLDVYKRQVLNWRGRKLSAVWSAPSRPVQTTARSA